MSVIFAVTPIVAVGGWPLLAAAAAASAASLGLRALAGEGLREEVVVTRTVALDVPAVAGVAEGVRADDQIVFGGAGVRVTVARDARGKVTVHAAGENKTEAELRTLGETFLHRAMQQYAYQKVASELKKKGFKIVEEQVAERQAIRIRFRRQE